MKEQKKQLKSIFDALFLAGIEEKLFCKKAKINPSTLYRWRKGHTKCKSLVTVATIARKLIGEKSRELASCHRMLDRMIENSEKN